MLIMRRTTPGRIQSGIPPPFIPMRFSPVTFYDVCVCCDVHVHACACACACACLCLCLCGDVHVHVYVCDDACDDACELVPP